LKQNVLPFMVDFAYLEQGIRVRGAWYPVLKMQWVEGFTLNEFVKQYVDQPKYLDLLCQIWLRLARGLRQATLAHCDLQHGNVLLVPGDANKLAVELVADNTLVTTRRKSTVEVVGPQSIIRRRAGRKSRGWVWAAAAVLLLLVLGAGVVGSVLFLGGKGDSTTSEKLVAQKDGSQK